MWIVTYIIVGLNLPSRQQSPSDHVVGHNQWGQYQNLCTEETRHY